MRVEARGEEKGTEEDAEEGEDEGYVHVYRGRNWGQKGVTGRGVD